MGVTQSYSGLFSTPGFFVSPSYLSMSSIFGLRSSYMLEYRWLLALLLRSARYFPGVEGKWTSLPPISLPSFWPMSIGIFKKYIYWLCYYSYPFLFPFILLPPPPPRLTPAFSLHSCLWVVHISSLASPFPILLLTSCCLFCTYWVF